MNKTTAPSSTLAKPVATIPITRTVNGPKLVNELHQATGATVHFIQSKPGTATLQVMKLPAGQTVAHLETIIANHNPAPVVPAAVAQLRRWGHITPGEREALLLTALKKLYQVK